MSLRDDALGTLGRWVPPDDAQERLRRRYVAHLRARPDALARTCRPDHLTASTLVLSSDRARVLLTLHAKARRWFQLGGHCEDGPDGDATLAGAALREATEESGLGGRLALDPVPVQLSEHAVPFCGPADDALVHHLDVRFVALAAADAAYQVSEESLDLRWWPVDDLPDGAADVVPLVELALARVAQASVWSSGGGSTWAAADQPSR